MAGLSQFEALVTGALQALKFEAPSSSSGRIGGPQKWKVTPATVAYIKSLEGKTVTVGSDGQITAD
jgi:hypothetical protein